MVVLEKPNEPNVKILRVIFHYNEEEYRWKRMKNELQAILLLFAFFSFVFKEKEEKIV